MIGNLTQNDHLSHQFGALENPQFVSTLDIPAVALCHLLHKQTLNAVTLTVYVVNIV